MNRRSGGLGFNCQITFPVIRHELLVALDVGVFRRAGFCEFQHNSLAGGIDDLDAGIPDLLCASRGAFADGPERLAPLQLYLCLKTFEISCLSITLY